MLKSIANIGVIPRSSANIRMSTPESRLERWRPQQHFSAHRHWINDPNGLVWFDGEYHLFFQYNPEGSTWGHMSWGHAVSTDLVNWTELPVAIPEDSRAMAFSGSVVVDEHNTSGLGRPGEPVLVACFTACLQPPAQRQVQDLAYSTDRGRTWQRHAGNPVLDIGLKDFRDPKVFWHEPTARWVMVVVLPDEREARFYGSPNLLQWTELSRFSAPLDGQGIWECPDLMELPTEGGLTVWMFKVDTFGGHPSGETGARLFFGHFDGVRFVPEADDGAVRWADWGSDFYAALSWSNLPKHTWKGAGVWLAWMSCHRYANQVPTEVWRGAMTLPRVLRAGRREGRWELVQEVIPQAATLRGTGHPFAGCRLAEVDPAVVLWTSSRAGEVGEGLELHWSIEAIEAIEAFQPMQPHGEGEQDQANADANLRGARPSPCAVLRLVASSSAGLDALDPRAHVIEIGYDAGAQALFIDRSRSGVIPLDDARYASRRWAPCRAPSSAQPLAIQVWWDESSIEVLADGGLVSLTEQVYPLGGHRRAECAVQGGHALLGPTTAWPLRAARFA